MSAVRFEKTGEVGIVMIDSPPVNALGEAVRDGLVRSMDQADADPDVTAIVIASTGRLFSAGADIREFAAPPTPPFLPDVVHRIEASGKPVVAAIQGNALGGGLEIALGCHYRVAGAGAMLGLPEVLLGLLPGACGTQRLPRLVGVEQALDLMLQGKPLAATDAATIGLVDEVVADEELLAAASAYALAKRGEPPRRLRDIAVPPHDASVFDQRRAAIASRTRGLLSPGKIIDCVEIAAAGDYENGCKAERDAFLECKASPQSDGLRHAFFAERAAARVEGIDATTATREIKKIGVIGAGTMGSGIAYSALLAGYAVTLVDSNVEGLTRGLATIDGYFDYAVGKGKLSDSAAAEGRARLATGADLSALADADLVIEAVFENMAIKESVFRELDEVCREGTVLATNTSTLDIDRIAAATSRPSDVVGMHFFSPAHIMKLLEIVRGGKTSAEVLATAMAVGRRLRKIGVVVGNCFGFVGNRMLYSFGREIQFLLLEGAAPEYIDEVLVDWGMAMGPNAVGDLAGLDVGYKVRQERDDLPDDPRFYRIADLLVEQGRYGQKTGKGMFLYKDGARSPQPDPQVHALIRAEAARLNVEQRIVPAVEIIERSIYALVTEGGRLLEEGIAQRSGDIDTVWNNGYGFPRHRGGPMHYADHVGAAIVYEKVCEFRDRFGAQYWQPPALLAELAQSGGKFGDYLPG